LRSGISAVVLLFSLTAVLTAALSFSNALLVGFGGMFLVLSFW
tara:strand:+ start:70 stop:198 length:129 start_codon:yes stop_codon:yes gene_type:complete